MNVLLEPHIVRVSYIYYKPWYETFYTEAHLIIRIIPCFSSLKNTRYISRAAVLVCVSDNPRFATWHDLFVLFKVSGGDNTIVKHLQLCFYKSNDQSNNSNETVSFNLFGFVVLSFLYLSSNLHSFTTFKPHIKCLFIPC